MAAHQPKKSLARQIAPRLHLCPGPDHVLRTAKELKIGDKLDHGEWLCFDIETIRTEPRQGLLLVFGKKGTIGTLFAPEDPVRIRNPHLQVIGG